MSSLPASGYFDYATNPTFTDFAAGLSLLRDFIAQGVGGAAIATLTISSGAVTPSSALVAIDTEGAAATDDLDTIQQTNTPTGFLLLVRSVDASRVVTLKHSTGNLQMLDSKDVELRSASEFVVFVRISGIWWEVARSIPNRLERVRALTSATTLTAADSATVITNTGSGGDLNHSLPAATVGMTLKVRVTAAHKIKLTANGTDTIRDDDGTTVSAAGGNTEIAAVVGNAFDIACFEAAKWVVTYSRGTLTTT